MKNKKDVLWFGTSLTRPLNIKKFEQDTKTNLSRIEVYGIAKDEKRLQCSNNLKDSVNEALKDNENVDAIVLEAGSKEITDINITETLRDSKANIEDSKKQWINKVESDSEAIFDVATNALIGSNVKDVFILKRFPRFDNDDPFDIKKDLTEHANNHLDKLWKSNDVYEIMGSNFIV